MGSPACWVIERVGGVPAWVMLDDDSDEDSGNPLWMTGASGLEIADTWVSQAAAEQVALELTQRGIRCAAVAFELARQHSTGAKPRTASPRARNVRAELAAELEALVHQVEETAARGGRADLLDAQRLAELEACADVLALVAAEVRP